jgi:uncharacterized membrane protein YuzA (DUF378 family)
MKVLHIISFTLVVIGGLNWGLVGLWNFNLVEALGLPMGLVKVVYILVGLSAVYLALTHKEDCMMCMQMMGGKKKKK